ncbi:hypothetical protein HDF08_001960 [Edaphobacter lichenicola]|uniref:Uncharacterized protein n=2 Tax=Tunturiibacter TaxID=3154218 RepID=A0A852VAG7_9BACT|nr:hypothetical protein [Edaphobacter lichenicola]
MGSILEALQIIIPNITSIVCNEGRKFSWDERSFEVDYQSRLQTVWVRVVWLSELLGIIPFITVPFVTRAMNDAILDVLAYYAR